MALKGQEEVVAVVAVASFKKEYVCCVTVDSQNYAVCKLLCSMCVKGGPISL